MKINKDNKDEYKYAMELSVSSLAHDLERLMVDEMGNIKNYNRSDMFDIIYPYFISLKED